MIGHNRKQRKMHNIEKSAFRIGQYVGYGKGKVWEIKKTNSSFGNWSARAMLPQSREIDMLEPMVFAMRLKDLSEKLAKLV